MHRPLKDLSLVLLCSVALTKSGYARENVDPTSPISAIGSEVDFQITSNIPIPHGETLVNFRAVLKDNIQEVELSYDEPPFDLKNSSFYCTMKLRKSYPENIVLRASDVRLDALKVDTWQTFPSPRNTTSVPDRPVQRTRRITITVDSARIEYFSCAQTDIVGFNDNKGEDMFERHHRKVQDIFNAFGGYIKLNLNNPIEVDP